MVNADDKGVEVPLEYVENGQIVLNIAMQSVDSLRLGNDAIEFKARFGGIGRSLYVPVNAVMAIYAKENGRGMVFSEDESEPPPPPSKSETTRSKIKDSKAKKGSGRPNLTVVK